jgi:type IV secretory pathway TrbL component
MGGTGVIDSFLTRYIDSGFGLLSGEVAFLATTLAAIDITLAAIFWSWAADEDIIARLAKKTLFVGVFAYAMGLTTNQIHQPFVGVASCWNEAAPCNVALMRQAQAVKKGVSSAGGTPREFCTITVTDGIAMGHDGMRSSLPSRECNRRIRPCR